jgi:hypothetical protein
MTTKQQFMARCNELAVTPEDNNGVLYVEAPIGFVWQATETHELTLSYDYPRGAWRMADAYTALLEDMEGGVIPCTSRDCDWCEDNGIDTSERE